MNPFLITVSLVLSLFGFAGGGGSDSGGDFGGDFGGGDFDFDFSDGVSGGTVGWIIFFAELIFIVIVGAHEDHKKKKSSTLSATDKANAVSALLDTDHHDTAREKWIHEAAEKVFVDYQKDWSNFDFKNIQTYTTKDYYAHASLMLQALQAIGRKNVVSDLKVRKVCLLTKVEDTATLPMEISVLYKFDGSDWVVEAATNKTLNYDKVYGATEIWQFVYDGKTLKLAKIKQLSESASHLVESLKAFARDHKLYYSPDWGRLALPAKGLIFNSDCFKVADVNNHIIGQWKNCLVQMYTYSPTPNMPDLYFLVGQINVSKKYEGVIVEPHGTNLKIPKNYQKYEMEWGEFNDRYDVYAASKDALPAFELLNPAFMSILYDKNLSYTLEVTGNTIYIFAQIETANEKDYAELLEILSKAYSELKM